MRSRVRLPGLLSGLAFIGACAGDGPAIDTEPTCGASDEPAELIIGPFSDGAHVVFEEGTLPVWDAIQGGVVVGLNLLAYDTPQAAELVVVFVHDAATGVVLGGLVSNRATHFLCFERDGVRAARMLMVPMHADTADALAGIAVRVSASVRFPARGRRPALELSSTLEIVLDARTP